jgi:hypothetical protein
MEADQRNARIFGVLYLITFATSIPALLLFQPALDDPAAYIAGGGKDSQHGAGYHGCPRVPVGAVPRDLLHRKGLQARIADPPARPAA